MEYLYYFFLKSRTTFKDEYLSCSMCHEWFKRYKKRPVVDRRRFSFKTVSSDDDHRGFTDWKGFVYNAFFHRDETINRYIEILRHLRQDVRKKRPKMWVNREWILYHENAPCAFSFLIREFCYDSYCRPFLLTRSGPRRFLFVPKNKKAHEKRKVADVEVIKKNG